MKIQLKFFASLREVLKTSSETLTVPDGIQTIRDLREFLISRGDPWSVALAHGKAVRVALNHEMVEEDVPLLDGAELAFFPPVTGG
ncbi:MAG: molybdopterin converting factor subunit 1 [Polynucleobacter sp.]|nr:MAG: molybdopterin converting factor subunit 1 [Polynucleobacter sp.]